jgi:acetolactate synthase-1/2/3 large subunit
VNLGITGDLKDTLEAFNCREFPGLSLESWTEKLREGYRKFQARLASLADSDGIPMHPLRLVKELEDQRTDDSILVLDGANSILWAIMMAQPRPQGGVIISTLGDLEAIGAGVPQALALKRAHPERQVILHTGDGSFGYGFMEMETAIRYGIPLVVVIHNDQGWGMTRDMQMEYWGKNREIGNDLGVVRYDRMVEALGGHGEFVENPADLQPALERALNAKKAACVNVMVDPKPKSPGLMMFMLMEVMLGKETYFDRIPGWMQKLQNIGLDTLATRTMLRYLDRMLHKEMK